MTTETPIFSSSIRNVSIFNPSSSEAANLLSKKNLLLLSEILSDCKIPLDLWDSGRAKKVLDLLKELSAGECVITEDTIGILRVVKPVYLDVFFFDQKKGASRILQEVMVINKNEDGSLKEHSHIRELPSSLGEKRKFGEASIAAANRALIEELSCPPGTYHPQTISETSDFLLSPSYPGLRSLYLGTRINVSLDESVYQPNGSVNITHPCADPKGYAYIENRPDENKVTFFNWKDISHYQSMI